MAKAKTVHTKKQAPNKTKKTTSKPKSNQGGEEPKKRRRSAKATRNSKILSVTKREGKYEIPVARFKRLVKACAALASKGRDSGLHLDKEYQISKKGLSMLQALEEKIIRDLFIRANTFARRARRVTVQKQDLVSVIKTDKNLFAIATKNNRDFSLIDRDQISVMLS